MSKTNLITTKLWESYEKRFKDFGITNKIIKSGLDSIMSEVLKKIHSREDKITQFINTEQQKKKLTIGHHGNFGSIRYIIRPDGKSTLDIKVSIHSQNDFNSNFLTPKFTPKMGYVYFVSSEYGIKIGKTTKLKDRMQFFGVKLPFDIELIGTVKTLDFSKVENDLHKLLKNSNINGEWFKLSKEDWVIINNYLSINNLELK